MKHELRITENHYQMLRKHLFPNDGFESVAVALCGRLSTIKKEILLVREVYLIPDELCIERNEQCIQWPTSEISHFFEKLLSEDFAIVKIHSHPGGYNQFSEVDDASDEEFFSSVFGWSDSDKPHASFVFLPDDKLFGRVFYPDLRSFEVDKTTITGDCIHIKTAVEETKLDAFFERNIQAFGLQTNMLLKHLRIGVIGCSGTGSPVIEQLTRLGVGGLLLIDPDDVEYKNLNRIINSTKEDAENRVSKVDMFKSILAKVDMGTRVEAIKTNLYKAGIDDLKNLATCDVIFGCVDSVDGRHLLSHLSTYYIVPYFDLGVKLSADGKGGVDSICGTYNYLQAGKSSLFTRGLYDMEDLKAANQFRQNQNEYENLQKNSYIKNIKVNSPAVISINMITASHAINDFLNRIHNYKNEEPSYYAQSTINVSESVIMNSSEAEFKVDDYLKKYKGYGDSSPFIGLTDIT